MHFGATLRLLRLESGLSLRDLARRVDVSGAYLSRVENGLDSIPTPARLKAIARELALPAPLLMTLAHRVSPLVVDYVQQVPAAGTLFLEIAHRKLDEQQLAEVREWVNERFPSADSANGSSAPGISDLLSRDRIVLQFAGSDIEDVLDVAAGRLAIATGHPAHVISACLNKRESEISSAIGSGVAIPCGYLANTEPVAALVTLADPMKYDTPDEQLLRVIVILLGPRNSPDRRLRLAHVARLAARGLADELAYADSPDSVLEQLALLEALA